MGGILAPDQSLVAEQSIKSANGRALLVMQGDGNLVVYEYFNSGGRTALWATGTDGNPGARAVMQGDGNLVVYRKDNRPIWASNTNGNPGSHLAMQDDGNLVVYRPDRRPIWASNRFLSYRKLPFSPSQHGFRFPNAFVNVVANLPGFGEIKTGGRCGGMAYAAADFYLSGRPVPPWEQSVFAPGAVPPDGNWLADYIYRRLFDSFATPSAVKFGTWMQLSDHATWVNKGVTRLTKEDEFTRLRRIIDAGKPAVLGLITAGNISAIAKNHQVLAYGYEHDRSTGRITVYVYDNNSVGKEVTLCSERSQKDWTASNRSEPWRGWFVQDYAHRQPPLTSTRPAATGTVVTYGSTVKLSHLWTGYTLHSHAFNYGHTGSSRQQQVTCFDGNDDNDLWRIKGPHGQPDSSKSGQPVKHGDVVRLEHVATRRNLHSHSGHPSPVTRQQEVTCFGANGLGDGNDDWRLEVDGGGTWTSSQRIRLVHVPTNHTLHSHRNASHKDWTRGQQEVTGFGGRDNNDWWALLEKR